MGTEDHHETPEKSVPEVLSPAKTARLERLFEAARQKASGLNPNFDYAAELYEQCVLGNPGNDIYVKAYVELLQKKYNNNRSGATLAQFKERGARNAVKKALADKQWNEVIKNGLRVLAVNPWDVPTLTALAAAAKNLLHYENEMFYLKTALSVNAKDPVVNKLCAIAAAERQLLDQAIYCWHQVEEAHPEDDEARRAISILQSERMKKGGFTVETPGKTQGIAHTTVPGLTVHEEVKESLEQKLLKEIEKDPKQLPRYLELAECYFSEDKFEKAEEILGKAFELSNGDLDIREKWEDAKLRCFRQKIITTQDAEKKQQLQKEYYLKELDFFKKRCERYPSNLFFRYDLGLRYFITKQYNEAIRELQLSQKDPRRKGVSLLMLGKCFQQIRQPRMALNHYEMAINELTDRELDTRKEALYLAAKLALTTNAVDAAEKHLTTLAAMDFSYKDIPALLDKLAEIRKNQMPGPRQATPPPPPKVG